jgi:MFS family permease
VAGALLSAVFNIADRVNPRRLMCYGAVGAAIANLVLLSQPPVIVAIVLRGVTGFCLASVYPPAMKAMATWFKRSRGTALGIMVGALTLGSATPNLVNGLGGLDWRIVIAATSAFSAMGGLIAVGFGRDGPFAFPRGRFDPRQAWAAFSQRPVLLASLGYFGHMWELYAMWAWFSVFFAAALSQQHVAQASTWSALAAFAAIGIGALGCWLGGDLGDRWGRANTTSLAMVISAICALAIGWLPGLAWPALLAIGLVWGIFVVADSAQFSTVITELGDQAYVGSALTLQLAIGYVLTVPTLWLIPLIEADYGWGYAFALLAIGPICGTVAMQRLKPIEQQHREAIVHSIR